MLLRPATTPLPDPAAYLHHHRYRRRRLHCRFGTLFLRRFSLSNRMCVRPCSQHLLQVSRGGTVLPGPPEAHRLPGRLRVRCGSPWGDDGGGDDDDDHNDDKT